jgi:hypothetical protein
MRKARMEPKAEVFDRIGVKAAEVAGEAVFEGVGEVIRAMRSKR